MEKVKRIRILALVMSLLLLFGGCAASAQENAAYGLGGMVAQTESYSMNSVADMAAPAAAPMMEEAAAEKVYPDKKAANTTAQTEAYAKKIIYTAYLHLVADVPADAAEIAGEACAALGGYVAASYERTYTDGRAYASATLKVPADQLQTLLSKLSSLGTQKELQLQSDDVTQSYYDVQARLKTAQEEEKTLLTLLADCETVEEVLLVREQLAYVRGEIERYQTSIDLWDHQVAYATVELTVNETEKTAVEGENTTIEVWKASDVGRRIVNGFDNSWRFLANAVSAVGIALSYLLLPCAVLGVIVYGIVRLIKLSRRAAKRRIEQRKVARAEKNAAETKKNE